jgi:hypothetical protein
MKPKRWPNSVISQSESWSWHRDRELFFSTNSIDTLFCCFSGTFAFILPNEQGREQPVASSSKAPASQTASDADQEEKEITYDFRENVIPAKSSKWMYYEDERKHRYSGRTTERGEALPLEYDQSFIGADQDDLSQLGLGS